jgi:hypothetical protein
MPLGMDPNPQISSISQEISQIVDAQGTAKNFLQQSIVKASMQPSLRRKDRFSPLSRVGEDFWVPSRRLLCTPLSTFTAFKKKLLVTVFAKIRHEKYDVAI